MKFHQVTDKMQWDNFVLENGPRSGAYLHSWGWGVLQAKQHVVERWGMFQKEELMAAVQMIKFNIGGGFWYWYAPRGPIVKGGRTQLAEVFNAVQDMAEGAVAFRFDAPAEGGTVDGKRLVASPHDVQPHATTMVDLTKDTSDILKAMHQKTRYNIRLAERHDVRVEMHGVEAFDDFWGLLSQTADRTGFRTHKKDHYKRLLEASDKALNMFCSVATQDKIPIAAAILADFGKTRTYLHGASDYDYRQHMAPFALHWHLIQDAKEQGMRWYDFWGIAPTDDSTEKLAGVTRFKQGFGGDEVRYPKTMDLILQPMKYKLYRAIHGLLIR